MAASVEQSRALTASSVVAEGKKRRDDALHGLLTDSAACGARPALAGIPPLSRSIRRHRGMEACVDRLPVVLGGWECGEQDPHVTLQQRSQPRSEHHDGAREQARIQRLRGKSGYLRLAFRSHGSVFCSAGAGMRAHG
ncbi:hypothetical protein PMIN01_00267 [Paraphaeosphaeria minitans]|uniref:Uncharacterized protein n=1 Tax=Paraphaeosphaeria minitans TaxID=565426 RepID=A0A9P6GT38_9PLEO|nr:hypothetical protein PMIN01_00267 [Paraphaeosphaeria minitans]